MDMIYAVPCALRTRESGLTHLIYFNKCSCSEQDPVACLAMYIFKKPFPG